MGECGGAGAERVRDAGVGRTGERGRGASKSCPKAIRGAGPLRGTKVLGAKRFVRMRSPPCALRVDDIPCIRRRSRARQVVGPTPDALAKLDHSKSAHRVAQRRAIGRGSS
jgi:hypothetical protein